MNPRDRLRKELDTSGCTCGLRELIEERIKECKCEIEYLRNKDTLYIEPIKRLETEIAYYRDILSGEPRKFRLMTFVKKV